MSWNQLLPTFLALNLKDIYLLRDSMKGLFFLAASKYPKNRETRAPSVEEFNQAVTEETLLDACKYLEDQGKHIHLLDAPKKILMGTHISLDIIRLRILIILLLIKMAKKLGILPLIMAISGLKFLNKYSLNKIN